MPPGFPTLAGWEDVFHEILSHLRPSEYFVFDDDDEVATRFFLRRTLLSLAVSCHAFFDPALDMLWYSLDNIHPLLKLLPNYQRRDSIYYLEGEIPPVAWSRLKTYANRVRGLTFSRKAGIDASVWRTILEQSQGDPLLPNLRKFHTIKLNAIHIFALRAFASSSLRDIFLEFYEDLDGDRTPNSVAPIAGSVLQEFSFKAPEITNLCLYPDLTIGREHLMCLSRFAHLEELYLNDHLALDEDLLSTLNDIKSLTYMKIPILLRDPPESTRVYLRNEFLNLTGLDLCGSPAHLARFIVSSSMPQLKELSVCVPMMGHGPLDLCIQNLVGAEEEETQLDVAVVLDRLFPRLDLDYGIEELRQYGGNANPYTQESENVSKLLRAMRLGREHYPRGIEPLARVQSS